MAILMLITSSTEKPDIHEIDDVVKIYPDNHVFTPTEEEKYSFLTISGTVSELEAYIRNVMPTRASAYLWESDNEWHFDYPLIGKPLDEIKVYNPGGNKWYKLDKELRTYVNISDLSELEKLNLTVEGLSHPAALNYVERMMKNPFDKISNQDEIKDLRNQTPE